MRITPNITSQNSLYNIQQARAEMDKTQEKIASGKNYNRPSDDPVAARLLIGFSDQLRSGEQYVSNMTKANIWLNVTETALEGMSATMAEIKKLTATLTSGTDITAVRQNAISQLQTFKQQLVDYGNTQLNGIYVFAGTTDNQSVPFSGSAYSGDDNPIDIDLASSSSQTMNITGGRLLKGTNTVPHQYGSTDILTELDNLITAVNANDINNIQVGAQKMEDGANQVNNAITDVGGRLKRIATMQQFNGTTKSVIQSVVANVQNADYAKLAVEMQQQQLAFEATLSSTAKVTQMSLLDYL
jgi:flagellar hook-associated protein 3 FlgL